MITDNEIREVYKEDTIGRKYHTPITTKKSTKTVDENPSEEVTIKLDEPMNYQEFKGLDDVVKKLYLKHLVEKYNVTASMVAEMFGIANNTFSTNVSSRLKVNDLFKHPRPNTEQIKAWDKFLNHGRENRCTLNQVSFELEGYIVAEDIAKVIQPICDGDTLCKVRMLIERIDGGNE